MTTFSRRLRAATTVLIVLLPVLVSGNVESIAQATGRRAVSAPGAQNSALVLRVYFRDNAERDRLATELSAEEVPTLGGYLTAMGNSDTYNRLLSRGLHVEIDQARTEEVRNLSQSIATNLNPTSNGDTQTKFQLLTSNFQVGQTFFGGYLTVAGIESYIDQVVAAHPDIVEKVDIGDSWCKTHTGQCTQPTTWNGYDLWVLHITNRSIPGPKPVFWLDAGIHSREVATPEVAMRFVSYLLNSYSTDADAHWLVDQHDIWVMPLFNPDGHFIVEHGMGANMPLFQRKNADRDDGCSLYPPRDIMQFGTDLNRNFPFKWGCCNGSERAACDQTYRGPSEDSEEETQAVTARIRQLVPDQRGPDDTDASPITATGVYQNLHSFADLDLYPWGWQGTEAPNGEDLKNIAAHMSAPDAGGNGYQYCQSPNCLYVADGTAVDWGYGELGLVSVTTELSGGSFFPAYSNVDGLWEGNKGMLLYLAKIARTPFLTTRGPDANNTSAGVDAVQQGAPVQLSATINYKWTGNSYVQNVAAAEYYIDTPPWAGGTPLPMTAKDGSLNSPTEDVQATVDTVGLAPGRHLVFVRGRGVADYEGLQSWGPFSAAWLVIAPPGPSPALEGANHRSTGTRPGR